ncbi:MAG: hypothetical protein ABWZ30_01035 [Jiangellaceae bacterium]
MPKTTVHPAIEAIKADLAVIELDVTTSYTLADAMREGARHTGQLNGDFVRADASCGLGAAFLSAAARGYVQH